MPGLLVGDVVAVSYRGVIDDQQWITTFQYQVLVPSGNTSVITDLNSIINAENTDAGSVYHKFLACIPATTQVDYISAQQIQPLRSVRRDIVPTAAVGTRGNSLTPNLAAVITKGTDSGARGQVGSIHLPGVATDDMLDGFLVAGLVTAMSTLGSTMLNEWALAGLLDMYPVLYHPNLKNEAGVIIRPWFADRLTRTIPQPQVRVMRRRTVGVGK